MAHSIKPGVATGDEVQEIFKFAKQHGFALPAVGQPFPPDIGLQAPLSLFRILFSQPHRWRTKFRITGNEQGFFIHQDSCRTGVAVVSSLASTA